MAGMITFQGMVDSDGTQVWSPLTGRQLEFLHLHILFFRQG
jgi:hypothetical protein